MNRWECAGYKALKQSVKIKRNSRSAKKVFSSFQMLKRLSIPIRSKPLYKINNNHLIVANLKIKPPIIDLNKEK